MPLCDQLLAQKGLNKSLVTLYSVLKDSFLMLTSQCNLLAELGQECQDI